MSLKVGKNAEKKNNMAEIDDQILKNFDIKKRLGKGAYGIVWKAIDKKTQQTVAVKKIFDAFRNETDAQRTFREIMFLRAFRNHPNIIQLHSIHRAINHMDIYLSFEFMESDLHNVIKRGSILKDIHKRFVMYQLLNAMQFIHSGNVIHRDIKPSNVLLNSKCRCKLADFGLARSLSQHPNGNHQTANDCVEPILTDYVATRWYRAPEILVASKKYTMGIDMWSLGCILGEMIREKPLFPGSCTVNQMELIIAALPDVTENDIQSVGATFGAALLSQNKSNATENPNLDELLSGSLGDARHLVKSLLVLDPSKRLTAKEALNHKYIEKFRNASPESELQSDIVPPFRDDVQLSVSEYRSKLYEIMSSREKIGYFGKKDDKKLQDAPDPKLQVNSTSYVDLNGKKIMGTATKCVDRKNTNGQNTHSRTATIGPNTIATSVSKTTKSHQNIAIRDTGSLNHLCHSKTASANNIFEISSLDKSKVKNIKMLSNHSNDAGKLIAEDLCNAKSTISCHRASNKPSTLNEIGRRFSVDSQLRTAAYHRANESMANCVQASGRRQSIDSISSGDPPKPNTVNAAYNDKQNTKIMPSMTKQRVLNALQSRTASSILHKTQAVVGRYSSTVTGSNGIIKPATEKLRTSIGSCFRQQNDLATEDQYDSRLKHLEDKIRKHTANFKATACRADKITKPMIANSVDNGEQFRRKSVSPLNSCATVLASKKFDLFRANSEYNNNGETVPLKYMPSKYDVGGSGDGGGSNVHEDDRHYSSNKYNKRSNNYGVIRATDLYRIRAPEIIS